MENNQEMLLYRLLKSKLPIPPSILEEENGQYITAKKNMWMLVIFLQIEIATMKGR